MRMRNEEEKGRRFEYGLSALTTVLFKQIYGSAWFHIEFRNLHQPRNFECFPNLYDVLSLSCHETVIVSP